VTPRNPFSEGPVKKGGRDQLNILKEVISNGVKSCEPLVRGDMGEKVRSEHKDQECTQNGSKS